VGVALSLQAQSADKLSALNEDCTSGMISNLCPRFVGKLM
jgi:hypothetical protein